jgi:hypothetical protein
VCWRVVTYDWDYTLHDLCVVFQQAFPEAVGPFQFNFFIDHFSHRDLSTVLDYLFDMFDYLEDLDIGEL